MSACEVLPRIDESSSPSPNGENSRLEQLMISMLEERDKLMEKLRESQEAYTEATKKLSQVEADNNILMRQLQALMPDDEERLLTVLDELRANGGLMTNGLSDDFNKWPVARSFAQLARELAVAQEKVAEKEEEVGELKSERSNTRLLLEHLECLVARHERSLRMTVIKRQTSNAGVSSEVEVLKALKSLFDHHKALDEKVRERLRTAQERILLLEDELMLANQEMKTVRDSNRRMKRLIQQRNSVRMSMSIGYDNFSFTKEQLAMLEERDQTIGDLQFSLDEKTAQLEEAMHMREELMERVQELEEELSMVCLELKKSKGANKQMNEALSEQSQLQSKVNELEFELVESQQQFSSSSETNEQLTNQIESLRTELETLREEFSSLRQELSQKNQALTHAVSRNEDILQRNTEQLTLAEKKRGSAEHVILSQKETIERLQLEIAAAQERERINEKNVGQLQSTVDRMLNEAKERLRSHSAERKQLMDDKASYISKIEMHERNLKSSQMMNKELEEEVEQLKNQLNIAKGSSEAGSTVSGVVLRNKHAHMEKKQMRFSWQVTDIDDAMEKTVKDESKSLSSQTSVGGTSQTSGSGKEGEDAEGEWDVSQLVSMLETQVSKLDKQLESMGENMAEADEFDRVMQSVSEGSYRPSTSSSMETFPHSNPPPLRHSKKKYGTDVIPKHLHRVSFPSSLSPENSPTSITSNESFQSNNTKKSSLRHKASFSKLFRRSKGNGSRKSRRSSAPTFQSMMEGNDSPSQRDSVDYIDLLDTSEEREEDKKKKAQLLFSVLDQGIPFRKWDSKTLVAWLEVWVGVPFWYIAAIRNCLSSGDTLRQIHESELEQELGITNALHRLKLRLAVQEILAVTSNTKSHRTTSPYGEMAHNWIGDYWLPSLGLSQYKEVFKACLVDARMLEYLTKRNLRTALKMLDASHRNSLQFGISVLKKLDYDRNILESRRREVLIQSKKDVMVWTSDHVIEWVESIGLEVYAPNLKERGVHGGVIALDSDFDHEKLAMALQIPLVDIEVRKQLKNEFMNLLSVGTKRISSESQSHGKIVRRLSKRLKVVGNKSRMHVPMDHHSEFLPVRPHSPVLVSSNPTPLHMQSLMEDDRESASSINSSSTSNHDSRTHTPTEMAV